MTESVTSQRTRLSGARLAAAAGFVASPVPGFTTTENPSPAVARGTPGQPAVEFLGRLRPCGTAEQRFSCSAFLTAVHGLRPSALFAGEPRTVGTALFTVRAVGQFTARIRGNSVHSVDVTGTLSVYRRREPGASWDDVASFSSGILLAEYALTLRDVLSVVGSRREQASMVGEVRQRYTGTLNGKPAGVLFGGTAMRWRMAGSGRRSLTPQLSDAGASPPREFDISGNWTQQA